MKLTILFSGVDYNHPALGGGFGEGYKVRLGKDLVGDNYGYASAVPEPDDDPLDSCGTNTGSVGMYYSEIFYLPFSNCAPVLFFLCNVLI